MNPAQGSSSSVARNNVVEIHEPMELAAAIRMCRQGRRTAVCGPRLQFSSNRNIRLSQVVELACGCLSTASRQARQRRKLGVAGVKAPELAGAAVATTKRSMDYMMV